MKNPRKAEPLLPLFIVHWIFGLGIFEYPIGTPQPLFSLTYTSILVLIYCILAVITCPEIIKLYNGSDNLTLIVKIIFISQVFLTLTILIISRNMSKVSKKRK